MPPAAVGLKWRLFVDTAAESPGRRLPRRRRPAAAATGPILLDHHSLRCYVAE